MRNFTFPVLLFSLFSLPVQAADGHSCDFGALESEKINDHFYVIHGAGNVGVLIGEDGVFLVDDHMADVTPELLAVIREMSDGPIRYVVNTHVHGDHSGGNPGMSNEGAVIMAHDNVRRRLVNDGKQESSLPVITFNDEASVYLNGEAVRLIHVGHAHTDGDSIIYFEDSNIVHMGDVMFNNCFPFIDIGRGGSASGTLSAVEAVLNTIDDETVVVAGHGNTTNKAGLAAYHQAISVMVDSVAALKASGMSLEEVLEARPTAAYDETWTWMYGNAKSIVTAIYNSPD